MCAAPVGARYYVRVGRFEVYGNVDVSTYLVTQESGEIIKINND
jgi:hypothetical protein